MPKREHRSKLFREAREFHWYPSSRPLQVGILLTVAWIGFGVWYISNSVGWSGFLNQPLDVMGNFFEGAFAPMLFLWIVIGFFLQQKDIAANAQNIAKQAEQTQLNTFLEVSDLVMKQLGIISGHIYLATQGPEANGRETEESASALWMKFHHDDKIFIRKLLEYGSAAAGNQSLNPDIYYGNEYAAQHTEEYVATFEKLITLAETCDPDYVVRDALLEGTGQGVLYRTIMDVKAQREMARVAAEGRRGRRGETETNRELRPDG